MLGKEKCRILKEIRQKIADENDIPYVTRECRHQGDCRGTCPRCESELRYLEQQLAARAALGKRVAVAALCASMGFAAAGCAPVSRILDGPESDLTGAVAYEEPGERSDIEIETGEVAYPDEDEPCGSSLPDGGEEDETARMEIESGEVAWPDENEQLPGMIELTGDVYYPGEADNG